MQHEDSHWDQVRVTQVVDKTADVAIVTSVDTVNFPVLNRDRVKLISNKPSKCEALAQVCFVKKISRTSIFSGTARLLLL